MTPMLQGGILTGTVAQERRNAGLPAGVVDETWGWIGESTELFFCEASHWHVYTWDSLSLLLRGVARTQDCPHTLDLERVAEELRCQYLERGSLYIEELEGSFTVALLDGQAQRVLLYRSLLSSTWTYYHAGTDGLIFGDHVHDVLETSLVSPRLRSSVVPAYLVYGKTLGSETLYDGIERLLPGEQLCWERGELTRTQRQTFATLASFASGNENSPAHLELALADVLHDRASLNSRMGMLLSGGPNSHFLQAAFSRTSSELMPPSFSANVDHPLDWDSSAEAMRASRDLGTKHRFAEVPSDWAELLVQTIEQTGELPDLSSVLYFDTLAQTLGHNDLDVGISAVGASALFGNAMLGEFDAVERLRRVLPMRLARRAFKALAKALGATNLASSLWLIDHHDDVTSPLHPVNQLDSIAVTDTLHSIFGKSLLRRVQADRRSRLDQLGVPTSPTARLRALRLLGETLPNASMTTLLFNRQGLDLCCPFLDSRIVRLSSLLGRSAHPSTGRLQSPSRSRAKAKRERMLLQALVPGGTLASLVEQMDVPEFLDRRSLDRLRRSPSPLLYRLLCFDLWHKSLAGTKTIRPNLDPRGNGERSSIPSMREVA